MNGSRPADEGAARPTKAEPSFHHKQQLTCTSDALAFMKSSISIMSELLLTPKRHTRSLQTVLIAWFSLSLPFSTAARDRLQAGFVQNSWLAVDPRPLHEQWDARAAHTDRGKLLRTLAGLLFGSLLTPADQLVDRVGEGGWGGRGVRVRERERESSYFQ